jgi:hypothetical protein
MKRGQTTLEFLTTYGWLLLVLLGFLIIIFLFSLSPEVLLPETCDAPEGIECLSVDATVDGHLQALLQNEHRLDRAITDASCLYEGSVTVTTKRLLFNGAETRTYTWKPGEFLAIDCHFKFDNPFTQPGEKQDVTLLLMIDDEDVRIPVRVGVTS